MVTIPPLGKAYVLGVFGLGIAVISHSIYAIVVDPIGYEWLFLAALTLLSGSATIRLNSVPATISISETFVFVSILLFGVGAGTLIVALDSLVISFWLVRRRPEPIRLLFNLSAPALSVWVAAHLFYLSAGVQPLIAEPTQISELVPSLLLTTIVYFLLNSGLTALAISFERKLNPLLVWKENFPWLSLNYFGGASLAALLVVYTRDIDITYLGLVVPLLVVIYLTFKTTIARIEETKEHLEEMNRLYLSTIETLAMAIDAKDQVTHGHIRRVQIYATRLAQEIGVKSDGELKAVEAAALLHDMGKLAIPEHILNKPGKLTPAEFEKMKRHASIGAEILSAIDFPYPVVPIVRHHHEQWDGRGYPDGIVGAEIPIGARVLSVVDCFDALTSDRPYRPKLSNSEALQILRDRSGSMYDPLVVETFIRVHKSIAPTEKDLDGKKAVGAIVASELEKRDAGQPPRIEKFATTGGAGELHLLKELTEHLTSIATFQEACDAISGYLRRQLPVSLCVFYMYDRAEDDLAARHASGELSDQVIGLRIPVGQRLTGWVGSNRRTIVNSDPTLDFVELARDFGPVLRSCLSSPVVAGDSLVGVISLYAEKPNAFSEDDHRMLETVSTLAARILFETSKGAPAVPVPATLPDQ